MKKPDKRESVNLFFSAFLIIAFIVCAHFFTQFTQSQSEPVGSIVAILIFSVFGLLLFYATRVGDGKAVKRFSLTTLLVMVVPSLYIIIASLAPGLPLNDVFASNSGSLSYIVVLACVALGYGIPYSFLSGFEAESDELAEANEMQSTALDGGIESELIAEETEAEDETAADPDEEEVEE